jgi:serine/threonine-protein kinase
LEGSVVTTSADIFSLGCLFYEIITGERIGLDRKISADMPLDLRAIIQKCLQQNPSDRYITVQALEDDILRYQQGAPVVARNGGALYKIGKSLSRYRIAYGVFALFLISLMKSNKNHKHKRAFRYL